MASVPYPKTWVSGEVLTAADLNAEFQAVNSISGITVSQLAPGAGANTFVRDPNPPADTGWVGAALSGMAETLIRSTAIVTRGGILLVSVNAIVDFVTEVSPTMHRFVLRVRTDGLAGTQAGKAFIQYRHEIGIDSFFTLSITAVIPGLAAGAHTISVTGQQLVTTSVSSIAGWTQAVELA